MGEFPEIGHGKSLMWHFSVLNSNNYMLASPNESLVVWKMGLLFRNYTISYID